MSAEFKSATPILSVRDIQTSIDYYVNKLGFTKSFDWPEDAKEKGFGGVCRGDVQIFFCRDGQGHPGTWLAIWVDDVDALHAEYQKRGATIRQPPTTMPWGVREMNIQDPDGHRLRVSMGTDAPPDGRPLVED